MASVCTSRLVLLLLFAGQCPVAHAARSLRRGLLHPLTNSSVTMPVSGAGHFDDGDAWEEDVWDNTTAFATDGLELDTDEEGNALLAGKGECPPDNGVTCMCGHPQHPCYKYSPRRHRCTCAKIMDPKECAAEKGQFCVRPEKCVDNCKLCKSTNFCTECNPGFHMIGGECHDMGMVFTKAHHGVKENLVLLGSEEVFHGLEMGFKGQVKRWRAEDYVIKEFLHFYKDVFDFIVVLPERHLEGKISYAENFHLEGASPDSKLRSAVIMQMNGRKKGALPLMKELEHEWGVFGDIEKLTPGRLKTAGPNWGMSVMHKRGMLGGFPASAVKCTEGVLGEKSCKQPLLWDFDQGSIKRGDDRVGDYNKFDMLLMGLITAKEMPDEKLIYCRGASKMRGKGVQKVTCKKIHVITAADIEEVRKPGKDERPLKQGDTLRAAVVVVMSKPEAVDAELERSGFDHNEDLAWLNKYIEEEPERFKAATDGRAFIDFKVTSADLRPEPSQAEEAQAVLDASKDLTQQAERKVDRAENTVESVEKADTA